MTDTEGVKIEYYPNRPLAQTAANRAQRKYADQGAYSTATQFEPNKGFVVVVFAENNIPDAWDEGFEVKTGQIRPEKADPDWKPGFGARKASNPTVATGTAAAVAGAPKGGVTAQVWAIADAVFADKGALDRAAIMAACDAAGIHKATAATQYSKWKRAKGL